MTYSGDTTIITSDSEEQAIKNSFDSDYCASHRILVIIRSKEFEKYLPTSKATSL
ncbi:MAG: hypothetical protein WA941_19090 [Nitrososphaeraceae archaeon]